MPLNFRTNQIISCGLLFILKIILAGIAVFKMNWSEHAEMPYIFLLLIIIYCWRLFTNKIFNKELNKFSRRKINLTINLLLFTIHILTLWQAHHSIPTEELVIAFLVIAIDIFLTESILDFVIDEENNDNAGNNNHDNNTAPSQRYKGLTRPNNA